MDKLDIYRAGHDINNFSLAGVSSYSARKNQAPVPSGVQIADIAGCSMRACYIYYGKLILKWGGHSFRWWYSNVAEISSTIIGGFSKWRIKQIL